MMVWPTNRDRNAQRHGRGEARWIRTSWSRFARWLDFRIAQPIERRVPSNGVVLIVQVNDWRDDALVLLLRSAEYMVRVADDSAALEMAQQQPPLVIVVGGAMNLNLYRALRRASAALILALVPDADRERMLEAFDAGVDDCQASPIAGAEIVARIRALLRNAQRPPRSGATSA